MFTGIIQTVGQIISVTPLAGADARVVIDAGELDLTDVALGDSIAANGVCLTVVALDTTQVPPRYSVDVSGETFACTTGFAAGRRVNLEKALRLSDRLGGHLVSGHVDGVGEVLALTRIGESHRFDIRAPESLARYLAAKGSIAVDGVSLTVNTVNGGDFSINLIPHTLEHTALGDLTPGSRVNLEADMLARYADRLMAYLDKKD
ncbi:MAG: riboflavin synthase [Betaproteobacteria bacterium]|nr:riboflavin synthase [Betaproteobacteria bacterium]